MPVTSLTKVFLSHLHADHVSDFITLLGSYVKAGRLDPLEVWGGASDRPGWSVAEFVAAIDRALDWDRNTLKGHVPISGFAATATEVAYDRNETFYDRDGVRITSFPVIHGLNGAVGFRLDYAGRSVVFSGDTLPSKTVVEAARGCDLLIHEAIAPAETFAELTGMPIEKARFVVNEGHTPAGAAGVIFDMVGPRMGALWHCQVIDGYIEPVIDGAAETFSGAIVLSQDRTVFNVTAGAVTVRQAAPEWQAPARSSGRAGRRRQQRRRIRRPPGSPRRSSTGSTAEQAGAGPSGSARRALNRPPGRSVRRGRNARP